MRRFNLRTAGLALAAAGLVVAGAGCAAETTGPTTDAWCGKKIGFFGALSGPNAPIVLPSRDGAKLAFKQYNEANPDCTLTMVEFDSVGDGAQANQFANTVVGDADFLGVIGGAFSGESEATMQTYDAASVAMISPSATRLDLTSKGFDVFHRVVGHDGTQSAAIAKYLADKGAKKVFVIDDGSAYGAGLTAELVKKLGTIAYEMAVFANRAGRVLTPQLIDELKNSVAAV